MGFLSRGAQPGRSAASSRFSLSPPFSSFRFLSKKQSEMGVRKDGHTLGSPVLLRLLPFPPPRGASPGHKDSTDPAARLAPPSPASAAGPGRRLLQKSKEQNQYPVQRAGFAPSAPGGCGAVVLRPHRQRGQSGVGMSFSKRGAEKHLQPRTGQSLAVCEDRAGAWSR